MAFSEAVSIALARRSAGPTYTFRAQSISLRIPDTEPSHVSIPKRLCRPIFEAMVIRLLFSELARGGSGHPVARNVLDMTKHNGFD